MKKGRETPTRADVSLSLRPKIKIKSFLSSKCLNKVLHHVGKYPQNRLYHSTHKYYLFYQPFNVIILQILLNVDNFGSCLTHLDISDLVPLGTKFLTHQKNNLASQILFTQSNAICFIIITSNENNSYNLYKPAVHKMCIVTYYLIALEAQSLISGITFDRYVIFHVLVTIRTLTLAEIRIALLAAGIENNPGPDQVVDATPLEKFEIVTINCNGLTCNLRLLQTVSKLKKCYKNKECIIFLQETHNANIILLESVWEGSVNVSPGTGGSRGVITLCTSKFKTISFKTDVEGRFLFTTIKLPDNRLINTINLYSPNDHNQSFQFITEVFNEWNSYYIKSLTFTTNPLLISSIIAGDFNCVLKPQDSQQRTWSSKEQRLADHILTNIESQDLYDSVLRSQNGNNFTWNRGNTFSKIDHVFVSKDILEATVKYSTLWDLIKSDHAAIQITINFNSNCSRGRSYPKLSLLDLKGDDTVRIIREEIKKAIEESPPHWNPHMRLDYVKLVIRTKILEIRAVNKKDKASIQALRDNVNFFCSLPFLNSQQATEFEYARSQLYKEEELEAEKLKLAAGIKWREQGERSNKFFLNSINVNRACSTLDYLNTTEGKITNISDILDYAKDFYSNLYDKYPTNHIDNFYKNCPSLSDVAQCDISLPLTISNLKEALKSCKDSTPGIDGIPYSYYKIFGNELLPLVLDAWKYSNVTGSLPQSQSTSVISLIPKAGKDKHDIRNWRPISISPCDLKIITKAYSLKVGKYLEEIICDSQMGYVPGRNINFNNRILKLALDHCSASNVDYSIMSLDAQKAYDSVDHVYISKTLKAYGFPDSFIQVVDILHNNLQAQVQINGFNSNTFSIRRGVKQGDALSCALFIIAIDPLIRNIETNRNIPSLSLSETCNIKSVAYADDIAIISENSNSTFNNIFAEYGKLTEMSGLTLNADKTEILNLSHSNKQSSSATYLNNDLTINHKTQITICGNCLSLDPSVSYKSNISDKILKLCNQLNLWKSRNLTINGKMIILKTFAISQLIFSSQFQVITQKDVRKIEHICYKFLWNGPDRIKRAILKSDREEGGINGIDIESFFHAIAVRQFFKSYNNKILAFVNDSPVIKEDIKTHARTILRKILLHQINSSETWDTTNSLWISQIRADFFVKPYSKTHELINRLNIGNISSVSSIPLRRGERSQIRKALPHRVLLVIDNPSAQLDINNIFYIAHGNKLKDINKCTSKEINDSIKTVLHKKVSYHPTDKYPIDKSCFGDIRITWHNLWRIKNPSLRAIRLKVLYKDIWCQEKRYKLGIASDNRCTICGKHETAIHQLFECENAKRIWEIANRLTGAKILNIIEEDQATLAKLIEVSPDIAVEIIKSVIFKFLIQINRSCDLNETEIRRTLAHWLNIEYQSLSKVLKNNSLLLTNLKSLVTNLKG